MCSYDKRQIHFNFRCYYSVERLARCRHSQVTAWPCILSFFDGRTVESKKIMIFKRFNQVNKKRQNFYSKNFILKYTILYVY